MHKSEIDEALGSIAVIGMAGRFPGARSVAEFWQKLQDATPGAETEDPVLGDVELFDPSFFDMSAREASLMDPQHRLLLMCAHEALEDAGYDPATYPGLVGIYGGKGESYYLARHVLPQEGDAALENSNECRILNDHDFLTSFISSKLDLRGPSVNVQAADSTSLVAISLASQSLLNHQCDIALGGGVSISLPLGANSGVGMVVLKRLAEAISDGDCIHAIIRGTAINHDGALINSHTSRGLDRRAEVIGMAQAIAEVDPDTVSYIEASGVATPFSDTREIKALTQVFSAGTRRNSFCALGSVKTVTGHLSAAAGVAGLIKTVLALNHKVIPPSLHTSSPERETDNASSLFYVNAQLSEWKSNGVPRRAGVNSFGSGGVNTHVVLEEAPERTSSSDSRAWQLLVLSAKSEGALERATDNLVVYLREHPEANLAEIAYTLQTGRKSFAYRRALVCRDNADGLMALETRNPRRVLTSVPPVGRKSVAFMFSGLGNHYINMAQELYQTEPVFRTTVDQCCELLRPHLGVDLREVLYPNSSAVNAMSSQAGSAPGMNSGGIDLRKMLRRGEVADESADRLNQSLFSQPALFVVEYGLARLWMSWGIYPDAMIGYSIGEYVAACLAEVFSLEDALSLVAQRARMIQGLPGGAMLAVPLSEREIQPLLSHRVSLSASNGPNISVVGGPTEAVIELQQQLTQEGLACQRLQVVHAFHSKMMSPILDTFTATTKDLKLNPPKIPYLSNVTGDWITAEQAQDPKYWGEHLCQPVRFADGVQRLWRSGRILVEVGPGQTLCAWAMQQPENGGATERVALPSLRHSYEQQSDTAFILNTVGRLWLEGVPIEWPAFYAQERRYRISLPTYPFDLQRCWIEPRKPFDSTPAAKETRPDGDEDGREKKLDQKGARRFLPTPYVAARNEIEETLSQVWRELLNAPQVGIYDNFLALGGDSIRATQLVTRVSKMFEATLSLRDIFNSPTVADLAVILVQRQAEQADAGAVAQVLREIKQLP